MKALHYAPARPQFDKARLDELWALVADGLPHKTREDRIETGLKRLEEARSKTNAKWDGDVVSWLDAQMIWQLLAHEISGWIYADFNKALSSEKEGRNVLAGIIQFSRIAIHPLYQNALDTVNVTFPRSLLDEVLAGLLALDQGEVQPLLRPESRVARRDHNSFSLDQLRIEALCRVEYEIGQGIKVAKAREDVARAIGSNSETIRAWPRELKERIANLEETLKSARGAGALAVKINENPLYLTTAFPELGIVHMFEWLSSQPLESFGERYRALAGNRHWGRKA